MKDSLSSVSDVLVTDATAHTDTVKGAGMDMGGGISIDKSTDSIDVASPIDHSSVTGHTGGIDKSGIDRSGTTTTDSRMGEIIDLRSGKTPTITNISFPDFGRKFDKFQVNFNLYAPDIIKHGDEVDPNVFNPEKVDISITFEQVGHPLHKKTINAFFMIDYDRDLSGLSDKTTYQPGDPATKNVAIIVDGTPIQIWDQEEPDYLKEKYGSWHYDPAPWHVRFAPPGTGLWTFSFTVIFNGDRHTRFTLAEDRFKFYVKDSPNRGYVKAVKRNFRFANGDLYYPIGITNNPPQLYNEKSRRVDYNKVNFTYSRYMLDMIKAYSGNYTRMFATHERFGIEFEKLGNYATRTRQQRAYDLDELVEHAHFQGIYLQLCLEERLEFLEVPNPETINIYHWEGLNPYRLYKGMLPRQFWDHPDSKKAYKSKLRYTMARWGYSTAICAFEFMNEIDTTEDGHWWMGNYDIKYNPDSIKGSVIVSDWINEMISYCKKSLGSDQMFTVSVGGVNSEAPFYNHMIEGSKPFGYKDFVTRTNIDFYTDHYYVTSSLQDHYINYLANRARILYPDKPYILGEFGGGIKCSDDTRCLSTRLDGSGNRIRCADDGSSMQLELEGTDFLGNKYNYMNYGFHNALFTSILSGSSGAVTNYDGLTHNNSGWVHGLSNLPPLVNFFRGEDLNLENSIAIRSEYCGREQEVVIRETPREAKKITFFMSTDSYKNAYMSKILTSAELNQDIIANHPEAEAFALKYINGPNIHKIIGWVNNCSHWWYNLPHNFMELPDTICSNRAPVVTTLYELKLKIRNLSCNAVYRVEFYGVYANWPLVPFGPPEQGGLIPGFTYNRSSSCGTLIISVPPLPRLYADCGPYAPNYGFKIIPVEKGWGHGLIGVVLPPLVMIRKSPPLFAPLAEGIQPLAVNGDGTQIAFRALDGSLQCYYRSNPDVFTWTLGTLVPATSGAVMPGGSIARGASSNQVYYHGADDRLQVAYWDVSRWAHTHLTDWSNTTQNVGGDIGSNAAGGKIFYRGIDGQLHMYLYDSGWRHSVHSLAKAHRPAADTNFAVSADGNFVAFKGRDGSLVFVWYDATSRSYKDDFHTGDLVSGLIRMNRLGDVLFYRGADGRLHQVYYESGGWHSRVIVSTWGPVSFDGPFDIKPDSAKNDAQIYFRGGDGFVQVAFVSGGVWIQGPLNPCGAEPNYRKCKVGGYVRCEHGMVAYETNIVAGGHAPTSELSDHSLQAYYYGKCEDNDYPPLFRKGH